MVANCSYANLWRRRYGLFKQWVDAHNRLPKRKASCQNEKSLAAWLAACQQRHRIGRLSPLQLKSLQVVPGMKARIREWYALRTTATKRAARTKIAATAKGVALAEKTSPAKRARPCKAICTASCPEGSVARDGTQSQFHIGSRVSIWSKSSQTWFPDGIVTRLGPDGVEVLFKDQSLEKRVPWDWAAQRLRLNSEGLSFAEGDEVAVWSCTKHSWIHDGKVVEMSSSGVTVTCNGGSLQILVPIHLAADLVILNSQHQHVMTGSQGAPEKSKATTGESSSSKLQPARASPRSCAKEAPTAKRLLYLAETVEIATTLSKGSMLFDANALAKRRRFLNKARAQLACLRQEF